MTARKCTDFGKPFSYSDFHSTIFEFITVSGTKKLWVRNFGGIYVHWNGSWTYQILTGAVFFVKNEQTLNRLPMTWCNLYAIHFPFDRNKIHWIRYSKEKAGKEVHNTTLPHWSSFIFDSMCNAFGDYLYQVYHMLLEFYFQLTFSCYFAQYPWEHASFKFNFLFADVVHTVF